MTSWTSDLSIAIESALCPRERYVDGDVGEIEPNWDMTGRDRGKRIEAGGMRCRRLLVESEVE